MKPIKHEPCITCYIKGRNFSKERCKECSYYKAVEIIKNLLSIDGNIDFDTILKDTQKQDKTKR
jgi:hypothetical protein